MTVRLLVGDCRAKLNELPDNSVHVCCTSPPFFGLRDYGTARWEGGDDPSCDHIERRIDLNNGFNERWGNAPGEKKQEQGRAEQYKSLCGTCGATRVDGQIGLEGSLAEFIAALVGVFREVRRVLHPTGLLFVNMGDSYASNWPCNRRNVIGSGSLENGKRENRPPRMPDGLKEKDLMLVPARLAIALVDDGWWLRAENVWAKPNCMPESVRDRTTRSHEFVYMFAKQPRYYYDADAVAESSGDPRAGTVQAAYSDKIAADVGAMNHNTRVGLMREREYPSSRNLRSVWTITPEPYSGAHFATFPRELPRRCIKAGSSERGACPSCLSPWRRVVERERVAYANGIGNGTTNQQVKAVDSVGRTSSFVTGEGTVGVTTGWEQTCACPPHQPQPCVVLDPFSGAGTTGVVCVELSRDYVGIELSPEYAAMSLERINAEPPPLFQLADVAPVQDVNGYVPLPMFATVGVE